MRKTVMLAATVLVTLSALVEAADHQVTQKGRLFSVESITIKKGDTITFLNDDSVPHNIMSTSAGNERIQSWLAGARHLDASDLQSGWRIRSHLRHSSAHEDDS